MRDLKPHEIEIRVQTESDKGASFLLYKTVRVDAQILDETFGPLGWCNRYYRDDKGVLVCRIGVYDSQHHLILKEDAGIESQQTDDNVKKAEYSDAFKRAGFKWGIGVELYTSPFIWVPFGKYKTRKDKQGRDRFADKLTVQDIKIENKRITGLAIINSAGERVYYFKEQEKGQSK